MGRMSDLDIEHQNAESDDGGCSERNDGALEIEAEQRWHEQLQEALGRVLTLVAGGVEYPDASVTVSIEHRLRPFDTTIIARAYDWLDETAKADFARAVEVGIERATKEMFDD